MVTLHVHNTLACEGVLSSLRNEQYAIVKRRTFVFSRLCRQSKSMLEKSGMYTPPSMIDIATQLIHQTSNSRVPIILDTPNMERLCTRCVDAMMHILSVLTTLWENSTASKIHSLVVGLLYMMREGATFQNTILLPKIPLLSKVLCHETHMKRILNIRAKVVTEVENTFKMHVRKLSQTQLQHIGQLQYSLH